MNMGAGDLRHRVTIQRLTVTRDTFGGETSTWEDVATVWARVETIGGREYHRSGQTLAESTFTVTMRARRDVSQSMRLKWGLRYFNVGVVIPDVKLTLLTVGCTEVTI